MDARFDGRVTRALSGAAVRLDSVQLNEQVSIDEFVRRDAHESVTARALATDRKWEGGISYRGGEMTMGIHSIGRLVRRSVFGGVGALLCLNAPLSSAADASDEVVRSEIVGFGDLNLSNPEGVAVLYRRIKAAAHRVCSDRNNSHAFDLV